MPVPSLPGLRPTPERVRETVFDWLQFLFGDFSGLRALDLFAGSAAMGLEAASRGASEVVWVDANRQVAANVRAALKRFGAEADRYRAYQADAFAFLTRESALYDLIFIDPPFAQCWQERAVSAALECLAPEGLLYVEWPSSGMDEETLMALGLVRVRAGRAGAVAFELLARAESAMALRAKPDKTKRRGKLEETI